MHTYKPRDIDELSMNLMNTEKLANNCGGVVFELCCKLSCTWLSLEETLVATLL